MKRWDSFRKWLDKHDRMGVRALERGEKGAFHFHVATPQWWDAKEMWDAGERYGFGRVNVRVRPIEKAYYIAKYVGKGTDRRWLPRGMRQWACFGFKGVSAQDIKRTDTVRIVVPDMGHEKLFTLLEWVVGDSVAFRHRYRPHDGQPEEIHRMELKPAQSKDVLSQLVSGKIIAVGEFRGAQIRTIKWKDKRTQQEVSAVITEFQVELGGQGRKVSQWAPHGAKEADVKMPAFQRGETVAVVVSGINGYKDDPQISGEVRALPVLV